MCMVIDCPEQLAPQNLPALPLLPEKVEGSIQVAKFIEDRIMEVMTPPCNCCGYCIKLHLQICVCPGLYIQCQGELKDNRIGCSVGDRNKPTVLENIKRNNTESEKRRIKNKTTIYG